MSANSSGMSSPAIVPQGLILNVFVSNIARGIEDNLMIRILNIAGPLRTWRRVNDAANMPKSFGFAEFSDPQSVFRALRFLSGIHLRTADGLETKELSVKADKKTREYLDSIAENAITAEDEVNIKNLIKKLSLSSNDTMNGGSRDGPIAIDGAAFSGKGGSQEERSLFRQQIEASKIDQALPQRARFQDAPAPARRADVERNSNYVEVSRSARAQKMGFVRAKLGDNRNANDVQGIFDTIEEEEKRRKWMAEDKENAFAERLRQFEQRENTRIKNLDREEKAEIDLAARREARRKEAWDTLAALDDSLPEVQRADDFYINRERWWMRRKQHALREIAADEREVRLEEEEEERKRRREERAAERLRREAEADDEQMVQRAEDDAEEENSREKEVQEGAEEEEEEDTGPKGIKISLGTDQTAGKKRALQLEVEDDEERRKKRALPQLNFTEKELRYMGKSKEEIAEMERKERLAKTKELLAKIPSGKVELWRWPIKWELCTNKMLKAKLIPFISKKLTELLSGELDQDLVDFVVDAIRKHNSPDEILEELSMALEEDAELFMMKVWRMLIFETEFMAATGEM